MNSEQFENFAHMMDSMMSMFESVFYRLKPDSETDVNPTCTICEKCIETDSLMRKLQCDHLFHAECIVQYHNDHGVCPHCKKHTLIELDENEIFS